MAARLIGLISVVAAPGLCLPADRTGEAAKPAAAGLNPLPNTWVEAKLKYVLPEHVKDAHWQTTDGYCGSTYRTKSGAILSRTGVRSKSAGLSPGFYSNATLEWLMTSNIVRVVEIANWGGGSYGGGRLLKAYKDHPTPTPRHTYDGITYVPRLDAMYFMLGANWRVASKATEQAKAEHARDEKCTWKYTFADRRWHRIEDSIRRFWPTGRQVSPYEAHMQYWPEGDRILFLNDRGRYYAEFDVKTEKWAKLEPANKAPMSLYNARSTWDSKRGIWVFRLGPKLCTFDPRTRNFKALPNCPAGEKDKSKGVVHIPAHDVYLVTGATGSDTHVYDIDNGEWSTVKGGDIKLVNGYPQYDPKTDLVGLVYQLKAYVFRYVPGRTPTTAPTKGASK
ncbi:MAG: hypothetical protein WBF17_16885 [Phycisphaerae bacterium]